MYGFGEELTKENILSKVSAYAIFSYYSDNFKEVNKHFISDFREEDNPSCCIAQIKGDLLYTDFGTGKSYRAIDFVMAKFGVSYPEALQQINRDFQLGLGYILEFKPSRIDTPKIKVPPKFQDKKNSSIKIKKRNWEKHDYSFWYGRYYITEETLNAFSVVPITHFWVNGKMFKADKYAYSFDFYWEKDNSVFFRKIYQPYHKKIKWLSNGGKAYQGEGMLPKKGEVLIVTKSLKDVMVLYTLGYVSVAPPSESLFLDKKYLEKQSKRFNKLILFYDNDATGIAKAQEFSSRYNIPYVYIEEKYSQEEIKDISDFVEKYGLERTQNFLKDLFTF
jgi:hypothetical protein